MQATQHLHDHDHAHPSPLQAWLKTGLLLGLGVYFIYNIVTGNLTNYINVRFAWLSYLAAALFLLLAAASGWRLLRGENGGHGHDHGLSGGALAIIAIPLVLGTLIPSRPLGATAVSGDFNMNAAAGQNIVTFTKNPLDRNALDWIRMFNSGDDLSTFNGQQADVTGFVYRDDTFPENVFLAARFTISCCVADAVAVGLPVVWDETIPADTWVRVIGQFELGDFRGEQKPILRPSSVEVVAQPEHPYLYP